MKQVVTASVIKEVYIGNVSTDKIYAFKASDRVGGHVYKLHYLGKREGDYGWAFVSLANSSGYAYGITTRNNKGDAMILAIKIIVDYSFAVYEFETEKEFLEWALK